jgi:hypothetical protein
MEVGKPTTIRIDMPLILSVHVFSNSLTCKWSISTNLIFSAGFLTLEAFSHKSTDVATTHFFFNDGFKIGGFEILILQNHQKTTGNILALRSVPVFQLERRF